MEELSLEDVLGVLCIQIVSQYTPEDITGYIKAVDADNPELNVTDNAIEFLEQVMSGIQEPDVLDYKGYITEIITKLKDNKQMKESNRIIKVVKEMINSGAINEPKDYRKEMKSLLSVVPLSKEQIEELHEYLNDCIKRFETLGAVGITPINTDNLAVMSSVLEDMLTKPVNDCKCPDKHNLDEFNELVHKMAADYDKLSGQIPNLSDEDLRGVSKMHMIDMAEFVRSKSDDEQLLEDCLGCLEKLCTAIENQHKSFTTEFTSHSKEYVDAHLEFAQAVMNGELSAELADKLDELEGKLMNDAQQLKIATTFLVDLALGRDLILDLFDNKDCGCECEEDCDVDDYDCEKEEVDIDEVVKNMPVKLARAVEQVRRISIEADDYMEEMNSADQKLLPKLVANVGTALYDITLDIMAKLESAKLSNDDKQFLIKLSEGFINCQYDNVESRLYDFEDVLSYREYNIIESFVYGDTEPDYGIFIDILGKLVNAGLDNANEVVIRMLVMFHMDMVLEFLKK